MRKSSASSILRPSNGREETLRQLGKTLSLEKQQAQDAENENLAALQGFYDAAGKPAGLNPVTWAKKKLAEPVTELGADITAIGKLRAAFEALKAFPERLESGWVAVATAKNALATAEKALADAIASATEGAGEALAVLETGRDYLHAHPAVAECPLCGSDEKISGLADFDWRTAQNPRFAESRRRGEEKVTERAK